MSGGIKTLAAESNCAEIASAVLPVRLKLIRFCVAIAVASYHGLIFAAGELPTAPQVTGGLASVSQTGLHQTINQTTDRAVINWGSFSIGPSASVNFNQPSATSITLNRVVGNDPTSIFGSLTANGRIFLVNPNGVYFAPGSSIDTGGLVATTMAIKDSDLMSGIFNFERTGNGEFENAGIITIRNGGYALLAADKVSNTATGRIDAAGGQILLASAERVTIDTKSDGLVGFSVSGHDIREVASVENAGIITADGGRIALSAKGSQELTGMVVNNTGVLRAQSFEERDGVVILSASSGNTKSSGSINVSGLQGGKAQVTNEKGTTVVSGNITAKGSEGKGGDVQLLGNQVGLFDQANIDASGKAGGGTVLVGGDYQGKNRSIQNAKRVVVGKDATITADAIETGDGGKIIAWSDNDTRFYGTASAKGGAASGNGGFVEVSGKETLTFKGKVDTRASNGKAGTLLLDPTNIVIQNGLGDGDDADVLTNSFAGGATPGTVSSGDATPTTLFESELEGIAATTNIELSATDNITIKDLLDNQLNLAQGALNSVSFTSASFNMNSGDTIRTQGGAININAGTMILGGLNSGSGAINLTSTDTGNSMSLANIDTTGTATFKSSGRIFQQANTRIAANTVIADNVNNLDVGLNNQVNNFNAINATGSSIFFKSVNNLNVSAIDVGNTGSVNINSSNALTTGGITASTITLNSGSTGNIGNLNSAGVIDVTTVGAATIGTMDSNGGAISIFTSGATNVGQITSDGGNVSINGVGSKTFSNILSGGGDIVLNSANNIVTGNLTADGGAISIDNGSFGGNGSITAGNVSSINSAGALSIFIKSGNSLTLNGAVTATADATSSAGITIESKNNLTINQNITATGGGTFGQKAASVSITSTNGNLTQTTGQIKALDTGAMQVDTDQNAHSAEVVIEASNGSVTTKDVLAKSDGGRGQVNITARNGVTATGSIIVEAASQPGISINSEKNDGTGDINTATATIRATQEAEVTVAATPPATGSSNKDINKIVDNAGGISVVGNNLNLGALTSNSTAPSLSALYGISTNSRNNTTFNQTVITNSEAGILASTRGSGSLVQTTGSGILQSQALGLAGDRDKGVFKVKTDINSLTVLGGRGVDVDNSSHGSGVLTISALGRISDATTDPNTNTEIPATNKPVGGVRIQSRNIKLLSLDNQSSNTYKYDGTQTNVFLGSGRQDLKLIADNIEFVPATIQTKAATDVQLRPLTNNRNIQLASTDPGVAIFNTSIYTGALVTGLLNQFNPASNLVIGGDNNGVAFNGNIYIGNTGDTASKQISVGNMNVYFNTAQRVYNNYAANTDTPFSWNDGAFTSAPYNPSPAVLCPSVSTACLTRLTTGKIYIKDSLLQGAVADNRRRNVVTNGNGNGLGGTTPTNNSTSGSDGGDGSGGDGSSSGGGGGGNSGNDNDSGPGGSNEASNGPSGGGNDTTTPGQTGTTTNTNNPGQSSGNPGGTVGTQNNPSTPGNNSNTPTDAGGTNTGSLAGGGSFSGGDSGSNTNTANNPAGGSQNTGSNNNGNNPAGGGTLSGGTPPGDGTQVADNTGGPNGSGSSNNGGLNGGANNGNNSSSTGGGSLSGGSNAGGNLSGGGTQVADNTGNSGGGFSGGGTSGGNSNGGTGNSGGGTFSNGTGSGSGNGTGANGTQVADNGNTGGFSGGGSSGTTSSSGSNGSSGGGSFSNGGNGNSSSGTQLADSSNSGGFSGGTSGNASGSSGSSSSGTSGSSTSSGGTGSSGGGSLSNGSGNNGTGGNSNGNTQIVDNSGTSGLNGSSSGGFAGGASSGNGSPTFAGSGNVSANASGSGSNGGIGGGTFSDGSGIGGSSSNGTQLANNSSGSGGYSSSSGGGANGTGNIGNGQNGGSSLGGGSSSSANTSSGNQVADNAGISSGSSNNGNASGSSVNSGGSGSGGAGNSGGSSFSGGASGGDSTSNVQLADNGQNNDSGGFAGGATSTAGNAGSNGNSGTGSGSNADGSNGSGQNQTAGNNNVDNNSNGATGNGNSTTTASEGDNNSLFAGGAGGGASGEATVVASNNQPVEDLPACEDEGEGTKQITRAGQPNADLIQVKASGVRLRGNQGSINQQRASCVRATATN
ncbi:MAG TPA: hypothetical protein VK949_04855 [Methylotenera sp.]|nr:hypothetical protein [Methylotenera sp.]